MNYDFEIMKPWKLNGNYTGIAKKETTIWTVNVHNWTM
jgi:hypothetical protein